MVARTSESGDGCGGDVLELAGDCSTSLWTGERLPPMGERLIFRLLRVSLDPEVL